MFRNYQFKNINYRLIIETLILTIIGIMIIGSANSDFINKQIAGLIIGIIVMALISLVDFEWILSLHWLSYSFAVVLLMAVLLFGDTSLGAKRWLKIGIRFQPSEICKIFLVIFFAWYLTNHQEKLNTRNTVLKILALMIIPLVLILKEPDLSTTIVTFLVLVTMLYISGLSRKIALPVFLTFIILVAAYLLYVWQTESTPFLKSYQGLRILSWMFPNDYPQNSYQQQNSLMAIGSGQLFGKGLNNNSLDSVKNGNYISEPQTDFIFAVAGEEVGFVGCVIIIALLFLITIECYIAAKKANSLSGKLLCVGIGSIIGYQSFVNICVVTGLMPNTGLTLPFVSYGLTSLVTLFFGIGMVLNVGLQSRRKY